MEKKKTVMIAAAAVITVIVLGLIYVLSRPKPAAAVNKHVVLEVKDDTGAVKSYSADTNAAYLVNLMDELKSSSDFTYEAQNGDYGLYIISVNGLTADYNVNQAYWSVYVNGQYGSYGVSEQPVTDGDTYTLAYEK